MSFPEQIAAHYDPEIIFQNRKIERTRKALERYLGAGSKDTEPAPLVLAVPLHQSTRINQQSSIVIRASSYVYAVLLLSTFVQPPPVLFPR